jgi:enterochelin esterase-like enzyme
MKTPFPVVTATARLVVSLLALAVPLTAAADSTSAEAARSPSPVPAGKVSGPLAWRGKAYPGTVRHYWLYVPAQYQPMKPAALSVFLSGSHYVREDGPVRAAAILDTLIQRKEMPVTLALFLEPGREEGMGGPDSRAWQPDVVVPEYVATDDKFCRFLIEEFIPGAVKGYNLTKNAAGHAIVAPGSAAGAAFSAAWMRPDYFQKVVSHFGRFTQSKEAEDISEKIRSAPRKPLRFLFQGGTQDKKVAEALADKNYDHRVELAEGSASLSEVGPRLAEQLRWIWRDYLQEPPEFEELAAKAPADAPFGTPGTRWEVTFGGMSSPVTYEFRANGVLYWAEYQVSDNYEFRNGELTTTSPSDPPGRYRAWTIKDNTFARVIQNTNPDVEIGLTAKGTIKRAP